MSQWVPLIASISAIVVSLGGAVVSWRLNTAQAEDIASQVDQRVWQRAKAEIDRCHEEADALRDQVEMLTRYVGILRRELLNNGHAVPPMPIVTGRWNVERNGNDE